jgi:hypothetical protein
LALESRYVYTKSQRAEADEILTIGFTLPVIALISCYLTSRVAAQYGTQFNFSQVTAFPGDRHESLFLLTNETRLIFPFNSSPKRPNNTIIIRPDSTVIVRVFASPIFSSPYHLSLKSYFKIFSTALFISESGHYLWRSKL